MESNKELEISRELEVTKGLLEITKNKLFTAISTITELELVISIEREKNKKLLEAIEATGGGE
jgi:hypothetical protein